MLPDMIQKARGRKYYRLEAMDWTAPLRERFGDRCLLGEPLADYTTFQIGGAAECLVLPADEEEWSWLLGQTRRRGLPLTILGLGSNVIISDAGVPGVTASTRRMDGIRIVGGRLRARSGAVLNEAVAKSVALGLGGMEKLSGIPGTVGGALGINAGAFGAETYDVLDSFTALDPAGRLVRRARSELKWGYRRVEGVSDLVFMEAEWALVPGDPRGLLETRNATLHARALKQPLEHPSAGSVFRRPPNDYASRLIDSCGLKGLTVGRAQVSPKHAGFIVNLGGAMAAEVMELVRKVRAAVSARTGVLLELEQIPLGFSKEER